MSSNRLPRRARTHQRGATNSNNQQSRAHEVKIFGLERKVKTLTTTVNNFEEALKLLITDLNSRYISIRHLCNQNALLNSIQKDVKRQSMETQEIIDLIPDNDDDNENKRMEVDETIAELPATQAFTQTEPEQINQPLAGPDQNEQKNDVETTNNSIEIEMAEDIWADMPNESEWEALTQQY